MAISLDAVCGVFPGCGFGIFYYFIKIKELVAACCKLFL